MFGSKIIVFTEFNYLNGNNNRNKFKIFDKRFINKNKDKCKIIYQNNEYELKEYFEEIENNYNNKEEISFILKINKNINNISYMFFNCDELLLIRNISNINYSEDNKSFSNDIEDEFDLFNENAQKDKIFNQNEENNLYKDLEDDQKSSLKSTIRNEYTTNNFLSNSSNYKDNLIKSSEYYNFYNISNMSYMFNGCESLISLPDISKWNTSNVTDMNDIFRGCKSLISFPDISKWNTSKITNISYMFGECKSLISCPDISKWNTSNVIDMSNIFYGCESLESLPDIAEWNTSHVTNMSYMFYRCESLISLPDISKWKTSKITNMSYMFDECINCL